MKRIFEIDFEGDKDCLVAYHGLMQLLYKADFKPKELPNPEEWCECHKKHPTVQFPADSEGCKNCNRPIKPQEPKEKIEELERVNTFDSKTDYIIAFHKKINELIQAVNELRGVK